MKRTLGFSIYPEAILSFKGSVGVPSKGDLSNPKRPQQSSQTGCFRVSQGSPKQGTPIWPVNHTLADYPVRQPISTPYHPNKQIKTMRPAREVHWGVLVILYHIALYNTIQDYILLYHILYSTIQYIILQNNIIS